MHQALVGKFQRFSVLLMLLTLFLANAAFAEQHTITIGPSGYAASLQMSPTEYQNWILKDGYNNDTATLHSLTRDIYKQFKDNFDFVFFVLNDPGPYPPPPLFYYGILKGVSNSVTGIGAYTSTYDESSLYGSAGKLKSIMQLCTRNAILEGPSLHELMHTWGNYAIQTEGSNNYVTGEPNYVPHWGFTGGNTKGQLGGFVQSTLKANIDGNANRYSVEMFGTFANGGNSTPYSHFEQYLMGLIPAKDVESFDVFTGLSALDYRSVPNSFLFTAATRKTYTPDVIVQELGPRNPSYLTSQKKFSLLTVVLTPTALVDSEWTVVENGAKWFSQASDDGNPTMYNFWEATEGKATLEIGNLNAMGVADIKLNPGLRKEFTAHLNPARTLISLSITDPSAVEEILLMDPAGRIVLQSRKVSANPSLEISSIKSGVYLLGVVRKNNGTWFQKFVL